MNKRIRLLTWPATGQAAVGSIEGGLLARSTNEELAPMASMAKIIAALAVIEQLKPGQLDQSFTLNLQDVASYHAYAAQGGRVLKVYEGMALTPYQALEVILIFSANNITDTLVARVFGSAEAYKSYARAMLQRMGLRRTVIDDANGFSTATASTPSEIVTIGIAALKNPVIAEMVARPQTRIPEVGILKNTNELLGVDGVVGIKTGHTTPAGYCLVSAARHATQNRQQTTTIVAVIMGGLKATEVFGDSRKLLSSAKQVFGLI